jgi:LmbE family N-acetylglucosaminyl deacetylase
MIFKKALILAPHTDDGELGCGGTIHRLVEEGTKVYYVAFSTCRRSLPDGVPANTLELEVKKAVDILGLTQEQLILHDFDVRDFPSQRQDILEVMVTLNKAISPDVVFLPSSTDTHQDHQVIHNEGLRAFKNSSVFGYEMPWNNTVFTSNAFIKLSKENIEKKLEALKSYESQQGRTYLNREFIMGLAKVRGVQAATEYAEAFEAIRTII